MPGYTRDFLASIQRRYEQTDEPLPKIAADFEIGLRTLHRMIEREGWNKRSERPPRDLSQAIRALDEAQALLKAPASSDPAHGGVPDTDPPPGSQLRCSPPSPPLSLSSGGAARRPVGGGSDESAIARIEQLVAFELAAAEAMRARIRAEPCSPSEAARVARTLATLTQTLQALQRLRGGLAADTQHDDDIPRDINTFRRELARRIEAFVASRTDGGDAGRDPGAMVDRTRT